MTPFWEDVDPSVNSRHTNDRLQSAGGVRVTTTCSTDRRVQDVPMVVYSRSVRMIQSLTTAAVLTYYLLRRIFRKFVTMSLQKQNITMMCSCMPDRHALYQIMSSMLNSYEAYTLLSKARGAAWVYATANSPTHSDHLVNRRRQRFTTSH